MKKNILIGICGGISAYKSAYIISSLVQKDYEVKVVMTENAKKFITPLTIEILSKNKVLTNLWDINNKGIEHINIAKWTDLILIVPATYNIIGKIASGLADDMLTTIISATKKEVYFALAMNNIMYANPILTSNIDKLKQNGYKFIEADEGFLSCCDFAVGRLKNEEEIVRIIEKNFNQELPLKNRKILITASRTEEALDPIRYFSNKSSGKMGYILAKEANLLGAKVTLISGPTNEKKIENINIIKIKTALEMNKQVEKLFKNFDIIIGAAAVADYRPSEIFKNKIKKHNEILNIKLIKNPDIIFKIGKLKSKNQTLIGFCAENNNLIESAKLKLLEKNLDFIIANNLKYFNNKNNKIYVINKNLDVKEFKEMSKSNVAREILKLLY